MDESDKTYWRFQKIEERIKEDRERIQRDIEKTSADLDHLRKEHQELRSDYDKMISRSAGIFVAVMSIGAFIGWVITQVKDLFIKHQ